MSRKCSTCSHAQRREIDRRLALGGSIASIARDFGLHADAVTRHRNSHLTDQMRQAVKREDDEQAADDLLGELRTMTKVARGILGKALQSGQLKTALDAIGKVSRIVEIQAKLLGAIDEAPQVTIVDTSALVARLHDRVARLAPPPPQIEHEDE